VKNKYRQAVIGTFILFSITTNSYAAPSPGSSPGSPPASKEKVADVKPIQLPTVNKDDKGKSFIDDTLALSPSDIKHLKKEIYKRKQAAQTSPVPPPKPITRTIVLDLSPGAQPPVIRVAERNGASVIFTDSTGADWPILEDNNFAKDLFDVLIPLKDGPILNIASKGAYGQGNVAVFLKGLSVPAIFEMVAGQKETDSRVDIRIPKRGPKAKPLQVESKQFPDFDKTLIQFLSDTPPIGAKKISVKENSLDNDATVAGTQAWEYKDNLYVRTPYSPISPGALGYMSSNDGMNAYKLPITPIILMSIEGKIYKIRIEL